jgi:hypothetical protein
MYSLCTDVAMTACHIPRYTVQSVYWCHYDGLPYTPVHCTVCVLMSLLRTAICPGTHWTGETGWFPVPEEKRKSLDSAENRTTLSSPLPCRSPHHDNSTHILTHYAVIQLRGCTSYFHFASLNNHSVSFWQETIIRGPCNHMAEHAGPVVVVSQDRYWTLWFTRPSTLAQSIVLPTYIPKFEFWSWDWLNCKRFVRFLSRTIKLLDHGVILDHGYVMNGVSNSGVANGRRFMRQLMQELFINKIKHSFLNWRFPFLFVQLQQFSFSCLGVSFCQNNLEPPSPFKASLVSTPTTSM